MSIVAVFSVICKNKRFSLVVVVGGGLGHGVGCGEGCCRDGSRGFN